MWHWTLTTLAAGEARPRSARRRQRDVDRLIARVRHPSYTPELAPGLVAQLSLRQVRRVWNETTRLLAEPIDDRLRWDLVTLRDHLLRRLEELEDWSLPQARPPEPPSHGASRAT